MLLHVVTIIIVFLLFLHFGTGIIVFVAAALEDVGAVLAIKSPLPGKESV